MNAVERALSAGADAVEHGLDHIDGAQAELLTMLDRNQQPQLERVLVLPGENAFIRILILRDA